jgi:hypothetical protein
MNNTSSCCRWPGGLRTRFVWACFCLVWVCVRTFVQRTTFHDYFGQQRMVLHVACHAVVFAIAARTGRATRTTREKLTEFVDFPYDIDMGPCVPLPLLPPALPLLLPLLLLPLQHCCCCCSLLRKCLSTDAALHVAHTGTSLASARDQPRPRRVRSCLLMHLLMHLLMPAVASTLLKKAVPPQTLTAVVAKLPLRDAPLAASRTTTCTRCTNWSVS